MTILEILAARRSIGNSRCIGRPKRPRHGATFTYAVSSQGTGMTSPSLGRFNNREFRLVCWPSIPPTSVHSIIPSFGRQHTLVPSFFDLCAIDCNAHCGMLERCRTLQVRSTRHVVQACLRYIRRGHLAIEEGRSNGTPNLCTTAEENEKSCAHRSGADSVSV
jgi:hypothetical protein